MSRWFAVARAEFLGTLRRPAFLLATFGVPLLAIGVGFLLTNRPAPDVAETVATIDEVEGPDLPQTGTLGYVDLDGVVREIPSYLQGRMTPFESEEAARTALEGGAVDAYFLIPSGYLESGDVVRVARRFNPFPEDVALIELLLSANLVAESDPTRLQLLREPVQRSLIEVENVGERIADELGAGGGELAFLLGYVLAMILYTTIFMSASYLLQSVGTEKESRMMEVLLTSLRPIELLGGKVVGLGALGIGQTLLWGGTAFLLGQSGFFDLPLDELGVGPRLVGQILLLFVLGYLLFAVLMAGVGALVPSIKESGPATLLVAMPAILPLMLSTTLVENPHGATAVALSLFPLTAPITMAVRLAQGGVPLWQLAASLGGMVLAAPLLLLVVARLFRAQTVLAGGGFNARRILAALQEN